MWRNKREAAGNLHSIEKDQNVSNRWIFISSLLLLLPLSLYHLTCGFADIQTTHPHFARLSLSPILKSWLGFFDSNRKIVPFSRFQRIVESEVCNQSSPWKDSRETRRRRMRDSSVMMPVEMARIFATGMKNWWEEVNESTQWQDGIFFALCGAYALVSAIALVRSHRSKSSSFW